ncbi:MAG: hypothetical protein JXQ65_11560 [Candidatus Marinimicrobia bacterium]|nr:hypothetical protein [Candidatus Neomarinimicrobiota bacterium]
MAVLILVIILPTLVWEEEEAIQNLSRKRMSIIYKVEDFYHKMSDNYNEDPEMAIKIVSALRDSTVADSNFHGKQLLNLDGKTYEFDVMKDLFKSFDTTFAISYSLKDTVIDTLYRVTRWNESLRGFDTLSVSSTALSSVDADTVLGMETVARPATLTYYNQYYLTSEFAYRPLIDKKYIVEFSDEEPITIKDPIDFTYEEPRYVFFSFQDSSHGFIRNGEPSWK